MNITTFRQTTDVIHEDDVTADVTTTPQSPLMTSEENLALNASALPAGLYYCHVIYFSLAIILGVPGNTIVVTAYGVLKNKTSCDWYILYIGVLDLIVCLFRVPTHLAMETGHWQHHGTDALCKCVYWLSQSVISASVILFGFIAIDRYIRVCRPEVVISPSFSRNSIILITLCSVLFALPTPWMFANNAEGKCVLVPSRLGFRLVKAYYTVLFGAFIAMFLVVIVCYTFIIIKVRKSQWAMKDHRKRSQMGSAESNRRMWRMGRNNRVGMNFRPDFEVDAGVLGMMPDFTRKNVDKNEVCSVDSEKESLSAIARRLRNPMVKVSGDYCLWNRRLKQANPTTVAPIESSQTTETSATFDLIKDTKTYASPKLIPRPPTTVGEPDADLDNYSTFGVRAGQDERCIIPSSVHQNGGNASPGPPVSKHELSPGPTVCKDDLNPGSPKSKYNRNPSPSQSNDSTDLGPSVSKDCINPDTPENKQNMHSIPSESKHSIKLESLTTATVDEQKSENILSVQNMIAHSSEINAANHATDDRPLVQQPTVCNPTEMLSASTEENIIDSQENHTSPQPTVSSRLSLPRINKNQLFVNDLNNRLKPIIQTPITLNETRSSYSSGPKPHKSNSTGTNTQSCEPSTSVFILQPEENESCLTIPTVAEVTATPLTIPPEAEVTATQSTRSQCHTEVVSSSRSGRSSRHCLSRPFRLTVLLLLVTVVFVISWIPPFLAMAWYFYVGYTSPISPALMALRMYGPSGYVLNHFANPFMYLALSSSFRDTVRSMWRYVAARVRGLGEDFSEELAASNLQSASQQLQLQRRHLHGTFNLGNTAQESNG